MSFQIDSIDKRIIKLLTRDSRIPILEIGRDLKISGAAVHQRINKLKKNEIILGSHLTLNHKALGYLSCAYLGIYLEKASEYKKVTRQLNAIPEVLECHYTTGKYSLFIKMIAKNNDHLMTLLTDKIQRINGINRTETFISLDESINRILQP